MHNIANSIWCAEIMYIKNNQERIAGRVSIVVPTKNSESTIQTCLESLMAQTHKDIEILVIDNYSIDKTANIAKQFTKHVYQQGPERCTQRNAGFAYATGEYLMYIDSDMELTPEVVAQCVHVAHDEPECAITIHETSVGDGFWSKCKCLERSAYVGDTTIEGVRFFPATIIDAVGGFNESLVSAEDWDLVERIKKKGYPIMTIDARILHHEGKIKILKLWYKKMYYGRHLRSYVAKTKTNVTDTHRSFFYLITRVYYFRPALWRIWRSYIRAPHLMVGMWVMLTGELFFTGVGFLQGYFVKN